MVADISKAVLNVTEGKKMMEIERAWFRHLTLCSDDDHEFIINSFFITGIFSMLFLVFSDIFSHKRSKFQTSSFEETQSLSSTSNHKDEIQSHSEVEAEYQFAEAPNYK